MLPKGNRVRKTREFERVFSSRLSVSGQFVRISYADSQTKISRCAIVVSTKVSKKAVIRNKIKRRVRAIIGKSLPILTPPKDLVITCLPSSVSITFKEFEVDINKSLGKIFKNTI